RWFNRGCRWCKRVGTAVGLLILLGALVYGYIQYAKAMTPESYESPISGEVKVFSPDAEAILKSKVSEIWDGEKFVPSYEFKLVEKVEAKVEEPKSSVEELIVKHFGEDAPMALRIAKCESNFNPKAKNRYSTASGVFQIIKGTWIGNRRAMGLDTNLDLRFDAEENIKTAKFIYSKRGWQPWECVKFI
ncbi:MAG TPA: transglycosylase SLT domain-containing protein, partial [Flavobacterium sp.]|nr:transglycosylase SLT domain-containing protein [Flavobacterium sp.]